MIVVPRLHSFLYIVVMDFFNMDGALTCKTQLYQHGLVLLVHQAKSN
jgi:hypothetical protein